MARQKQTAPVQRAASSELVNMLPDDSPAESKQQNGVAKADVAEDSATAKAQEVAGTPGLRRLAFCALGIYVTFLTWSVLQEEITTTAFPVYPPTSEEPNPPTERFTFSIVLNTIYSAFSAITGFLYLYFSTPRGAKVPSVFPSKKIIFPLMLVSIASSLASPFGYASLAHVDYLTFILAKSCKLPPVMFLNMTIFRKRYPLYKYGVVLLVTLGVATFTLHQPDTSKKLAASAAKERSGSPAWGIFLLSINLLLDGLTNTTQDHVFSSPQVYTRFTGPQMMVAQNLLSTLLTSAYLLIMPHISSTGLLHAILPIPIPPSTDTELASAVSFLSRHPEVLKNVLKFAACGAIGQVFIYYTLSKFSSLVLVTITVTRKMLSMLLSVAWFGHALSAGQWLGLGLVFGGIGVEAAISRQEKKAKMAKKRE
ncbi:UDP-galactose transporter HUT1 [Aspergillus undulatus]|uniref:UDP-galactose transporter HUT1 n=1 Tax=Aspergillus undulatus TaxID=1810928 RepID=UPI003CCCB231